jgi:hypothetical protein
MQEKSLEKSIAFQKAAGKEPSSKITDYVFDYEREAKAFFKSYQECTGSECPITFIDASNLSNIKTFKELGTVNESNIIKRLAKESCDECGGSADRINDNLYITLNTTVLGKEGMGILEHSTSSHIIDSFAFDHEVGHVLCQDALTLDYANLKECIADSYAILRHYQRFGVESKALDNLHAMRAVSLILKGDVVHFTSAVLEHIIDDKTNIDFTALSPNETAQVARRYALFNAQHSQMVILNGKTFQSFNEKLPDISNGDFSALRQLANELQITKNPEEFKWGSLALRAILDGKVGFGQKRILPIGQEWMDVRKALDERDAELKETGILFGIQKPKPAAQNNKKALQCV